MALKWQQWHCFPYEINWCHWVPFWWYKHIRMIGMIEMHFPEFLVLRQKTLAAHISAPRRGTEAVQYSKSSSGVPLCTQTSSWPWGSIIRAPEPQKWARFENFQILKISPFWPKNQFFGVQKAENGWRTSMSPIIPWKYAVGGQNLWKNCQFTEFFLFFPFFCFFSNFFDFWPPQRWKSNALSTQKLTYGYSERILSFWPHFWRVQKRCTCQRAVGQILSFWLRRPGVDIFGDFLPFFGSKLTSIWPEVSKMVSWFKIAHFLAEL